MPDRTAMINHIAYFTALLASLVLLACGDIQPTIPTDRLPSLPEAVTNNAVAAVELPDGIALFSLLGLGAGKTWRDTSTRAFMLRPDGHEWLRIDDVPGPGRLASVAVAVGGKVFIFGGYTVAGDGSEVSVPDVYALDATRLQYSPRTPMPVPVDDTVAVAYADRYIYLISGWHNSGNVNLVQVYDTVLDTWFQATPYPGAAVFGHAGGIAGNSLVICGGARVLPNRLEPRSFAASPECYLGEIDNSDLARIHWYAIPSHPAATRYRAAASGIRQNGGEIVFAGGTDNPYNYDGIGYDGNASIPAALVFSWSVTAGRWQTYGSLDTPTMDHRGLLKLDGQLVIVGGMRAGQEVSNEVVAFSLPRP